MTDLSENGSKSKQSEKYAQIGRNCADYLKDDLAFCPSGGWHRYSGNRWERFDTDRVEVGVCRWLEMSGYSTGYCATSWVAKHVSVHNRRDFGEAYGRIPFRDVILDASDPLNWREIPHSPSTSTNWALDYDYTPGGDFAATDALLSSLLPCEKDRHALEAHVGLALMGDRRVQHCILIVGAPGAGKSTLLEHVLTTCGHSKSDTSSKELFRPDTDGANVRMGRVNDRMTALDEFPSDAIASDEGPFKKMVTHDAVRLKTLYRDSIDAQWRPKLIFATNDLPKFADCSGAISRRIYPIRAETVIANPDRGFADRLRPERAAWAVRCLLMASGLLASGRNSYDLSENAKAFLAEIAGEGDPIKAWVSECCDLGEDYYAQGEALHAAWRVWQVNNDERAVGRNTLLKALRNYRPFGVKNGRVGGQGEQVEVLRGIRLKSPV